MKNELDDIDAFDDEQTPFYFRVIGEDCKIHVSDLQTDHCKCGVKIKRKYITTKDNNSLFSCYECTY